MAHTIDGNPTIGYRVIDEAAGPITGRKKTPEDALAAAGIKKQSPAKKPAAKS